MDLVTEIFLKQETQKTWNKRMGKICHANTNKGKDDEATLMSYKWHASEGIKKITIYWWSFHSPGRYNNSKLACTT